MPTDKTTMGKPLRALNRTKGTVLCERLEVAASMAARGRGLLGRDSLAPGSGMLFESGGFLPFDVDANVFHAICHRHCISR